MTTYRRPHAPTQPPQHPMPSRRVSVPNQIKLLIAAAIFGGPRLKAFSIHDATKHAGIALGQARYSTRFFVEAGLWDSIGSGVYAPSQAGRDFGMCWESSRDKARAVLAERFATMWFYPTLVRELAVGPVPIEKLEAALLADGGGHQQHIKLLRSLLEWLNVALLIEQGQDGTVKAGPLLALEPSTDADADNHWAEPDVESDGCVAEDEKEPQVDAQSQDPGPGGVPGRRTPSVLAQLAVEAVHLLDPDEIPAFMKALAVLSRENHDSILHRC